MIRAFHGTNQVFDKFRLDPANRATHGASAASGIFMTTLPQVAEQYARLAHGKLFAGDHEGHIRTVERLMVEANSAAARRDFREYERLMTEAEDMEVAARDSEVGPRVLELEVDAKKPMVVSKAGRMDLYDMRGILEYAFSEGHDAVIFEDIWDPANLDEVSERYDHVVVSDPDLIRIVSVRELSPPETDAPSP